MPVLPSGRRQAARQQLEQVVARSALTRARRRPAVIAAAIVIVALCTGAATAGVAAYNAITNRAQARCFTVAKLNAGPGYVTTIAEPSKPETQAEVDNAVQACRVLFKTGVLKEGRPVVHAGWKHASHVPHLVPCIWYDGTAAVFPGHRATCKKLRLKAAAGR
jgi:hypothetical protein